MVRLSILDQRDDIFSNLRQRSAQDRLCPDREHSSTERGLPNQDSARSTCGDVPTQKARDAKCRLQVGLVTLLRVPHRLRKG